MKFPRPGVRVLCLPDVDRAIGGVKQLYRHVEHLVAFGWDAAIVTEVSGFRPSWFVSDAPTISLLESYERGELTPKSTILLLPETYIGVDLSSFRGIDLSKLSRVIFNQNGYYSLGNLGENIVSSINTYYHHSSVLHVLSVSEDTHTLLSKNFALPDSRLSRIINAIEPIFTPSQSPSNRFHWMPRKNPLDVNAVLTSLQQARLEHTAAWQGLPLQGLKHEQVAESLSNARLFLSFGHPEGFGLPIAEAMAAGCWVVGYSGGGGRELFRFGASEEVPFGDWSAFISAVQRAFTLFFEQPHEAALRLQRQSIAITSLYGRAQERASIELAWSRVEAEFYKWRHSHPQNS